MLIKKVRLGRNAELKRTASGDSVLQITGVYDIGYGDKKSSQWINASLWGKRADSIGALNLEKGVEVVLYMDDVQSEAYQGKNGLASIIKAKVVNLDLVSRAPAQAPAQNYQAPAPVQRAPAPAPSNFPDFDDDIPF